MEKNARRPVKIAITENEELTRGQIRLFLNRFSEEQSLPLAIHEYSNGKELLEAPSLQPDIILLDIDMPEMDGMSAAQKIRETDSDVILIFITQLAQYALQGYRVQAFDYLLKPVAYSSLLFSLQRAVRILQSRPEDTMLSLSFGGATTRVSIRDITYFEVSGHKVHCHTKKETFPTTSFTLTALEESLSPYQFVRCNNCYLVNLAHVRSVDKGTAIVGGDALAISRPRKKQFLTALADYMETI